MNIVPILRICNGAILSIIYSNCGLKFWIPCKIPKFENRRSKKRSCPWKKQPRERIYWEWAFNNSSYQIIRNLDGRRSWTFFFEQLVEKKVWLEINPKLYALRKKLKLLGEFFFGKFKWISSGNKKELPIPPFQNSFINQCNKSKKKATQFPFVFDFILKLSQKETSNPNLTG